LCVAQARSSRVGAGAVIVIIAIITVLAIAKDQHVRISAPPVGSGCLARSADFDVPLSPSQAGLAALIAGVAAHRSMPARAVTIAYATALQESKLANLPYGDRDSVGVFQQRPSEGWGTRRELLDPVYATTRFFTALAAVPDYQRLKIYQAAQAVQRSADGSAYGQYSGMGAAMATGFTGQQARSVWCWYGSGLSGPRRLSAASQQLISAFGRLHVSHVGDPVMFVRVRSQQSGWAVAAWLVTHASVFGIRDVSFQGYQWTAAHGQRGWTKIRRRGHRAAPGLAVSYG
jgi:hypothetical protein